MLLYCNNNKNKNNVPRLGDKRSAFKFLVIRPDGKRPLGRPKHKNDNNIKIDLVTVRTGNEGDL